MSDHFGVLCVKGFNKILCYMIYILSITYLKNRKDLHNTSIVLLKTTIVNGKHFQGRHWVKSVRIRSFSGLCFPAFELNLLCKSPYSTQMRENTEQKISRNGHFSRSAYYRRQGIEKISNLIFLQRIDFVFPYLLCYQKRVRSDSQTCPLKIHKVVFFY